MAEATDVPDTEDILEFVQLCRDEHIAPYPVGPESSVAARVCRCTRFGSQ
jgi:hypothetical protein